VDEPGSTLVTWTWKEEPPLEPPLTLDQAGGAFLLPHNSVCQDDIASSKPPFLMRLAPAVHVGAAGATTEVTMAVRTVRVVVVSTVPALTVAVVVVDIVVASVTGVAWRLQAAETALGAKSARAAGVS